MEGRIADVIRPVIAAAGMDLESVRVSAAGRRKLLRVVVDSDQGVSLDDAATISRKLSAALDAAPVMGDFPYTLEVSSPGLDRPLRNDADFRRFAGKKAELRTYGPVDGQRHFRGILLGVIGDAVVLQLDGRQVQVPKNQIAQARLLVEMDDLRADLDA